MRARNWLIVLGVTLAISSTASANAKRIKAQPKKIKASVKKVLVVTKPAKSLPSYALSPMSQTQAAPLEDVQIRGLKDQIQKNSKQLNQARWFLDEAYYDGVLPMSREVGEMTGKINEKRMNRQKVTKQELKDRAKAKRELAAFKKWIKPTEVKAKKLEKENKALSATLYQYILVAN
jgi:hypothetical protein